MSSPARLPGTQLLILKLLHWHLRCLRCRADELQSHASTARRAENSTSVDGSLPRWAGSQGMCLPGVGYNTPDWASWEDNPEAYTPDPCGSEHDPTQRKPWFPYNPADANSEDEFSDHDADVDLSQIHIPGEHILWHVMCCRCRCYLVRRPFGGGNSLLCALKLSVVLW